MHYALYAVVGDMLNKVVKFSWCGGSGVLVAL
jgi:hypothetical protein